MPDNISKTEISVKRTLPTAFIIVSISNHPIRQIMLDEELMTVGRDRDSSSAQIRLDSDAVSDLHGLFRKKDNGYIFESFVRDDRILINEKVLGSDDFDGAYRAVLHYGDVIQICNAQGPAVTIFYDNRYDPRDSKVEWRSLNLSNADEQLYISRSEELDDGREEVSSILSQLPRRFAILEKLNNDWYVADHNTQFGIQVNHCKVTDKRKLSPMDVILIGNSIFFYQDQLLHYNHVQTSKNNLSVHIQERSVRNFFRKQILLANIDMTIRPGEMVLILGGSGAGKTTFINAVMGYEKAIGTIREGDIDIYKNYNKMKYDIGFVPQQDLLRMDDTVISTLSNAAEMKIPKNVSEAEKKQRIQHVLETFGLERERSSLVSKLSGGQRKRLSIAVEYIGDPKLFFLDEPDSGLDGIMARSLMEDLRIIADENRIVLVITHQPDRVSDLFDKVIVLAKGVKDNIGHLAFFGIVEEALDFFETDSLEGIVRRINRPDEGGEGLADHFIEKFSLVKENQDG